MSIVHDMSDAGIAAQFGDIVNEMPELFEALRRFEMQNRPAMTSGGFKMRADWVSVQRGGGVLRLQVGNTRSME
jgi:hypothetical protein